MKKKYIPYVFIVTVVSMVSLFVLAFQNDKSLQHTNAKNIATTSTENESSSFSINSEVLQLQINNTLSEYHGNNIFGEGVAIAVLDTGIEENNSDIPIVEGMNFTTEEETDYFDRNGHGTKIAGIIGAQKNNKGLIGISPDSQLYIGKVAQDDGGVMYEDLIKGIEWAIEKNVDIINISLEFEEGSEELKDTITKATDKNIIVISSSGNLRYKGDTYQAYPGKYENVISVGMLNKEGNIYSEEFLEKKVDLYAPSEDLSASYFNDTLTLETGVSFGVAYTSGYAALILERYSNENKDMSREQVLSYLKKDLEQNVDIGF